MESNLMQSHHARTKLQLLVILIWDFSSFRLFQIPLDLISGFYVVISVGICICQVAIVILLHGHLEAKAKQEDKYLWNYRHHVNEVFNIL